MAGKERSPKCVRYIPFWKTVVRIEKGVYKTKSLYHFDSHQSCYNYIGQIASSDPNQMICFKIMRDAFSEPTVQ